MKRDNLKAVNKAILKARRELTSVKLKDIVRPTTIEEGRENLKRFYGCVDGDLVVLLNTKTLNGEFIGFYEGKRIDGKWVGFLNRKEKTEPHPAVNKLVITGNNVFVRVNVDKISNLSEIYRITNSGCFNGNSDPSFTMNFILGGNKPITQYDEDYFLKSWSLIDKVEKNLKAKNMLPDWVEDDTCFDLFDNEDLNLKPWNSFYLYSVEQDFGWRWRQMNNLDTRYLHWRLLGPLAPYEFVEDEELASAA